jgi:hypothetical protein
LNDLTPVVRKLFLASLGLPLAVPAEPSEPRTYTTDRATAPPRIDGLLDDAVWDRVEWGTGFLQREPEEGALPAGETAFKILYDDANLYVAYRAFDPEPEKVSSVLGRRDFFPGDWIEINIDSYHDHRTAFSFTASLSGTQGDEFVSQDGDNWDGNWDPVWEHEARPDEQGWTAEARIPLSQLRYGDQDEQVWGIQVQRRIFRLEERSVWQPIPKDEDGWVSRFGELRGIRGIRGQRRIEVLPYAIAQGETFEEVPGDPFATGTSGKVSGGLDGKFGVTSDLTLDLTVNPDFGQVEADPSVVNLTAFETFYPEKRPFFIEGANIFDFPIAPSVAFGTHTQDRLFYSRRIGRQPQYRADWYEEGWVDQPDQTSIVGALKLTGKTEDGVSIGVLESVTAKERAEIDLDGARRWVTVEPASNYFLGRVQKDYREGETRLGGMVTAANRKIDEAEVEFLHESAYGGGADLFHYLGDRSYYVALNVLASRVAGSEEAILRTQTSSARYYQRPDGHTSVDSTRTSLAGHAGSMRIGKSKGRFNFDGGVAWRSPGFEINDLGFLRNADEVNQFAWVGYGLRNPFWIFRRMQLNMSHWLDFVYGGENTYQAFNFNTNASFRNNWNYYVSVTRENERISTSELRGGPSIKLPGGTRVEGELNTDGTKTLAGGAGGGARVSDDDTGRENDAWMWLAWRPTNAIRFEVNPWYEHNRPDFQWVDQATDAAADPAYVYGSLDQHTFNLELRLDYAVTPELTVQFYGAPFVSAARYAEFRRITNPRADAYEDRFRRFSEGELRHDAAEDAYFVDESGDGAADWSFEDPDFNFRDFHSNLVVRWQYAPGSSIYAVWSQARSDISPDGTFVLRDDLRSLFSVHPQNVFLVKINRWFNL